LIQPALLGGLTLGVLSALPVVEFGNCCCCLWVALGGLIAAYLDQPPTRTTVNIGRGAAVGLLAGVIGAFVWLFVTLTLDAVMAPIKDQAISVLRERAADLPPQVAAWLDMYDQPRETTAGYIVGFMLHLLAGMIFATLGGWLGAVFFWRDNVPPALGGPPPPPPIPPEL
jgi:hypothetical protein